jgi:hypothetical protein
MAIKDLKGQDSQPIGIDCCQWVAFDNIPASLDDLWGCVPCCIRDNASVRLERISIGEYHKSHALLSDTNEM